MKFPFQYKMRHPIELKSADGDVLRRIEIVEIQRRPTFGDLRKVSLHDGIDREAAAVETLTDLTKADLNRLDLQDFMALQAIIAPFFEPQPTPVATE